ncbi:MAG: ABC transporter permease [Oscillospiraceae bacterium]|nr:ABC transporter permease [Oscillospiraceae bacterium]
MTQTAKRSEKFRELLEKSGILIVMAVLFLAFSLISGKFCTLSNLSNIFKQVSHIAILAIGMTFVFLFGGMDLSAGSNIFLGAVTVAALLTEGIPAWAAMLAAVLICTLMGALNGFIIEKFQINCVIVTLGSQFLIRGVALVLISHYRQWIYVKDPTVLFLNTGTVLGLPVLLLLTAALYAIAWLILNRSAFGRRVYAVGGNPKAAHLCGVNVAVTKLLCYLISGTSAGIAGVVIASRLGMVNTNVGLGMEFDAVTAVVLGGCAVKGGEGNVLKTFVGALIVAMISNFMTLVGVNEHYQDAVLGGFILLAAVFNHMTRKKSD